MCREQEREEGNPARGRDELTSFFFISVTAWSICPGSMPTRLVVTPATRSSRDRSFSGEAEQGGTGRESLGP